MAPERRYWNERMETLAPEAFREVQEAALARELDYLWEHSDFYKSKWSSAGLERGDIVGLDDLVKLPFTEKNELRDSLTQHPPLGSHRACALDDVIRVYSTSGTTGNPTYIGLTAHDRDVWIETAARGMWSCRMRPEHVVPLPIGTFFVAAAYGEAIERLGAMLVPVGVGATDRFLGAVRNLSADFVLSTASFPLYLIDYCEGKGIDSRSLGIKGFMVGGEPGGGIPQVRRRIEEAFGATVRECMGVGDMLGLIWAECEAGPGMHFIAQGACHPEIIDPETGESLEIRQGLAGELVYTSLDRECQPLVRFRTRDHVMVVRTECECGRTGFAVSCIGRTDDMLIVSGVNVYPAAVRDVLGQFQPRITGELVIELYEKPPTVKPPMKVRVEHGPQPGDLAQLKKEIEQRLREKLIFPSDITLVPPGSLPKYEYKAKLTEKHYED
ncbi:MAG: phenylacetate--CoA ligase family protein [Thermoleophilia bacterium]